MEFAQAFLTAVIEVVTIAGFGGIVVHALHASRCLPVKSFEQPMQEEIPAAPTTPVAENPIAPEPAIAQQKLTEEPLALTYEVIDNSFKVPVLRSLCDQHGIVWKDIRGKNKHALKPAMIQALMNANAF